MTKPIFSNWRILLGIWGLTALALTPFTIHHALQGNWYLAVIIGGLDVVLAAGSVWIYLHRHSPAHIRRTGHALIVLGNVVALLSMHAQGGQTAYWIYPIVFANFYVLPLAAGTALSVVFAALSLLAVAPTVPPDYLLRLLATTPLCLFFGIVFSLGMTRQRRQLQYLADHDALTGTGSRHAMKSGLADAVERKRRYDERCALIIFDIDRFKAINDSMGHMHADKVIAELAHFVADRVRTVDRLYRFGGEEFVLLLPHTGESLGWQLAEALRMEVEEHEFAAGTRITVSAGTAELAGDEDGETWLRRADDALMRAKEAGRNQVIAAAAQNTRVASTRDKSIDPRSRPATAGSEPSTVCSRATS